MTEAASDNDDDIDDDDIDDDDIDEAASTNATGNENEEACDMRVKQCQDAMPMPTMLIIAVAVAATTMITPSRLRRRGKLLLGRSCI